MNTATDYRNLAAACRRAADLRKGRRPTAYLINLAENYEKLAAQIELGSQIVRSPSRQPE